MQRPRWGHSTSPKAPVEEILRPASTKQSLRSVNVYMEASEHCFDIDHFLAVDYARVVASVGLITGDRDRCEDAVVDALAKLIAQPPPEPLRSPAAWVTTVAANILRSSQRRSSAEQRAFDRVATAMASEESVNDGTDATVESLAILDALDSLSAGQREICVLHYFLDHPVTEIAAALNLSPGTVKTQLFRARHALARVLQPDPADGGALDPLPNTSTLEAAHE